jgi:carbon monoxide dehydrogenase subunit G
MRARGSIVIAREPADVFRFVTDPSHDLSWRSYLAASHASPGEVAPGSVVRQTYSYQGRTAEVELEVTEFTPPSKVAFRARGKYPVRFTYTCEPEAGGTRFSMSGSLELTGMASMFEGRIQKELDAAIVSDLGRLKAALERATGS